MLAVQEHLRAVVDALGHPELAALSDPGERVRRLAAELPSEVWHKVQNKVTTSFQRLEDRYGRPMALAIISTAIVGTAVPLPGTSLLAAAPLIGLAELHQRLTGNAGTTVPGESKVNLSPVEIRRRGAQFVQNIADALKIV